MWKNWRQALLIVHPDTVVRWQRERFRRHWGGLSSKPGRIGRPPIQCEIRRLIQTLAKANPLWRAPRIHGELQKLGIAVSERTVSRVLRSIPRRPSQNWRTFLRNHMGETVAIDFFTVATIRLRVLFVFLVMEHGRRRVLHFGITEHPTAEWKGQQIVEAFWEGESETYVIRDRDKIYGEEFRRRLRSLSMKEVISGFQSPWQGLCGEADRLDSTGMSGPCGSAQPRAATSIAEELHGLLSPLADTLRVRQGCARATRDHAARRDHRDTASGRVAPTL
jgi:homeodomain-containing protein